MLLLYRIAVTLSRGTKSIECRYGSYIMMHKTKSCLLKNSTCYFFLQFDLPGFMPSTMEAIFLIRQLMKRCREQKKDLHMIFIDLEKAYDKVPRNVMWWALQKHKISSKYITLIKDMYDNVVTSVRTSDEDTNDFPINI
jgi:hypothetical protein